MEKKKKNNVGFLVAILILVGFPMLAMYYMNKGVNYRKDLFNQFEDYGLAQTLSGDSINSGENVLLVFFVEGAADAQKALVSMHSQFDNRKDVIFMVEGIHGIQDTAQVLGMIPSGKRVFAKALNISPDELPGQGLLIDRQGHLRKRYDLTNRKDIELFVRQVALLLPPKKTPKAELKRETEK